MNTRAYLLCLPTLHADFALSDIPQTLAAHVVHLWPGLPHMPTGYWQPDNYPFSPQQAAQCVQDILAAGDDAISGAAVQARLASASTAGARAQEQELQDIASFSQSGEYARTAGVDTALQKAAQLVLLHAWLMEEQHLELEQLTQTLNEHEQQFLHELTALDADDDPQTASTASLQTDPMLPSWERVLENAALFLPDTCILLCNSLALRQHLQENFTPCPLDHELWNLYHLPVENTAYASVTAPLWRILGHVKAKDHSPWLHRNITMLL